jgi:hypothetical protein
MSLRRRQELCLDAIEHSFAMAEIAYERIVDYCRNDGSSATDAKQNDRMVLDAWSFIDVAKRLRSVLEHTPGLKNATLLAEFLKATEEVVDFRHHMQHMEDRTTVLAPSGRPIWGSFSWAVLEPDGHRFRIGIYVPGRLTKTQGIPAVNPAGKEFHSDVDHFQVTIGNVTLQISEMHRRIRSLRERFEAALAGAQCRPTKTGETILGIDLDAPPPAA